MIQIGVIFPIKTVEYYKICSCNFCKLKKRKSRGWVANPKRIDDFEKINWQYPFLYMESVQLKRQTQIKVVANTCASSRGNT